jgi:arginine-tRNA-protein transferase
MSNTLKFGVTKSFPCNYLSAQEERLLVAIDEESNQTNNYSWLMSIGFRRSGDQIYRPHCENCAACQSIRVLVNAFVFSASQRKLWRKNSNLRVVYNTGEFEQYYSLYEQYINNIHADGAMYPANKEQFDQFLDCSITSQCFVETWLDNELICVAVTDVLDDALSAVYTFYHPKFRKLGLGVFSILSQINLTKLLNKPYLYLGYQIDDCQKMNYKDRYMPYQRLINNQWKLFTK